MEALGLIWNYKAWVILYQGLLLQIYEAIGLYSKLSKKFKITTNSKHNHFLTQNVLNKEITVNKPSKVWISDITYVPTNECFSYLTTVLDLFDRKVNG